MIFDVLTSFERRNVYLTNSGDQQVSIIALILVLAPAGAGRGLLGYAKRSPWALRLLKLSFHADEDGLAGIQQLAHDANLHFYGYEEAREGREAFKAKRAPDFSPFPRRP